MAVSKNVDDERSLHKTDKRSVLVLMCVCFSTYSYMYYTTGSLGWRYGIKHLDFDQLFLYKHHNFIRHFDRILSFVEKHLSCENVKIDATSPALPYFDYVSVQGCTSMTMSGNKFSARSRPDSWLRSRVGCMKISWHLYISTLFPLFCE